MRIQDVVMKLLIEQPYYGYVASTTSFVERVGIDTIKMVSIPELVIYYNPIWFEQLPSQVKMGVILHELLHVILLHQFRRNNREIVLWSVACDMAVNELLPDSYISPDMVTVPRISKKLKRDLDRNRNAEYYYNIINEGEVFPSFLTIDGDNLLISEGGMLLKAQKIPQDNATSAEINALKSSLSQMFTDAITEGGLPTGLEGELYEAVNGMKIDWRVILKRFLTGRGKMMTRKTYKRQSRRYDDLPGTKRSVGVNALLAIDESGSISDALVKQFYEELKEINKITGTTIVVTRFDTKCSQPVPLDKFVLESKREKRGGTDFRPVFLLADQHKIPLVIIFTDGDGEAPVAVNQNTLWVLSKNSKKPAAFGDVVNFER